MHGWNSFTVFIVTGVGGLFAGKEWRAEDGDAQHGQLPSSGFA
jgi:hypothetical protein